MQYKFLNKKISGPFTIPSGIITTHIKIIEKIANEIPEIGVITTKSIGLAPREGNREPILHQYAPGCFVNAVGLTNPGAEEFARQLSETKISKERFLLISIFGKDADEFVRVAKILEQYADGFELNLSCPHAKGYGMVIGQDPNLVKEIIAAVKAAVKVPVIPKLTPNAPNIGEIAKAAVEGGADAICAINTVGPGYFSIDGNPVLTNKMGGMSGSGILPIGLKCVKAIRESVNVPIIGCGGISNIQDVREYQKAGADIFGIGSALAGMSTEEMKKYFAELGRDFETGGVETLHCNVSTNIDMSYKKYRLVENKKLADDLSLLVFDGKFEIKSGQFVFAWIPDAGEKPFSVLDDSPLSLAIQKKGCFSSKLCELNMGDEVYFRGPYGHPLFEKPPLNLPLPKGEPSQKGRENETQNFASRKNEKIILVGGGCGLAALYQIARDLSRQAMGNSNGENAEIFFGAKDKDHLFYIDKMRDIAKVNISTNDGSEGHRGFVTDLLKKRLFEKSPDESFIFYNCGPEKMIEAVVEIEKQFASEDKIFSSIDYVAKCGVGICGSCGTKDGRRLCVDGPFLLSSRIPL